MCVFLEWDANDDESGSEDDDREIGVQEYVSAAPQKKSSAKPAPVKIETAAAQ